MGLPLLVVGRSKGCCNTRNTSFERFVAARAGAGGSASHRELYRMQTQGNAALPGGRGVLVLFEANAGTFGHSLEQVGLAQERGRWRVWTFQSTPFKRPT